MQIVVQESPRRTESINEAPGVPGSPLKSAEDAVMGDGQVETVFSISGVTVISCCDCASTTAFCLTRDCEQLRSCTAAISPIGGAISTRDPAFPLESKIGMVA